MFLTEATLQEAAGQLLASSTAGRYLREARRIAIESGLVDAVRSSREEYVRTRDRVDALLEQLARQNERSLAEFEVAILVCALARARTGTDVEGVAEFLHRSARSSSAWIRGLARRLAQLGPPSTDEFTELEVLLATVLTDDVHNRCQLRAFDRPDRRGFPRLLSPHPWSR